MSTVRRAESFPIVSRIENPNSLPAGCVLKLLRIEARRFRDAAGDRDAIAVPVLSSQSKVVAPADQMGCPFTNA
jgi:hypothetical protein